MRSRLDTGGVGTNMPGLASGMQTKKSPMLKLFPDEGIALKVGFIVRGPAYPPSRYTCTTGRNHGVRAISSLFSLHRYFIALVRGS